MSRNNQPTNKKDNPRDKKIELRVTENDKKKYQNKAESVGLNLSEYLRELLENGVVNVVENDVENNDQKVLFDEKKLLIGIGSNLNQLTRYSHQNKKLHQDIEDLILELKNILIH